MPRAPARLAGCAPAFGRHNSFAPRLGWPAKVHAALNDDPLAFARPGATVTLGVGSSMVRPMRFWSSAFGLIEDDDHATRPRPAHPTSRGHWLLDEDGADPYLEDLGTLWLLHWWLLSAEPCLLPTFRYFFGSWWKTRFTRAELRAAVQDAAVGTGWRRPADSVVAHDITALTAMYGTTRHRENDPWAVEEFVINPFRQLGLLDLDPEVRFTPPNWESGCRRGELLVDRRRGNNAPGAILAYACLTYAHDRGAQGPGTVALSRLHTDDRGPGRLMLADERALRTAIANVARDPAGQGLALAESSGGDLLAFEEPPLILANRVLAAYYRHPNGPDE
ncbi:DUF4007 family protein [Streptomyces sp. NPDC127098]|uniref:DUF4007 family protein n=1 Tax=Streptomyces sp. NPDC127098 TaxID=3347137 RepID=UPI00364AD557